MSEAPELPVHGGDVDAIAARYGTQGVWLDFSANINPLGPPRAVSEALRAGAEDSASLMRYPTASDRALQAALAQTLATSVERVVVGNGAAALIEAFIRTVQPQRCLVPQPAFSEYARAIAAQGATIVPFRLDPQADFALDAAALIATLQRERPDACILTNPHNPSGALTGRDVMQEILAAASAMGTAMLIDEAFVDYAPESSVAGWFTSERVLVLRSLTKFYAIPALRVGYGVAAPVFARAISARVPSWPITSLAANAAIAALGEHEYASRTRASTTAQRDCLATELRSLGLRVFPSAANFLLVTSFAPSSVLAESLARNHRIIVRDCGSYPTLERGGFIRLCVRSRADNAKLLLALAAELARLQTADNAGSVI